MRRTSGKMTCCADENDLQFSSAFEERAGCYLCSSVLFSLHGIAKTDVAQILKEERA